MDALEASVGRAVAELEARQAAYERASRELEAAAHDVDQALGRLIKVTDELLNDRRGTAP